jgi:formylglycine-generating enzyme required for sulfatase activity
VLVAFAAEPGKTASDTGQGSGPYAAALATELLKPGQNDLLMFHNVRVAVIQKTGGDQVPWTEDGIQRPQRVMFGGESKTAAIAQSALTEAERAWTAAKDMASIPVLEDFASRYKDTFYASLARARIEELKKQIAVAMPPKPPTPSAPAKPLCIEAPVGNKTRCLKPGDTFKDCPDCPEMVVIPSGSFMMGSPADEAERQDNEGPQRNVTIVKPFAVGKFEVTFAEWDACVAARGCKYIPDDRGWGRGKRPVMNVYWSNIVREFLPWLEHKVGKTYRLLTEAEWEYAARAGTTTAFSTGPSITTDQSNFDGNHAYGSSPKGRYRQRTMEVGSFQPNAFGLYDMHGNVWEWVEDCYKDSYSGAPTDGTAVPRGDCEDGRVLRGGSWVNNPGLLRSAKRFRNDGFSPITNGLYGFRLARTLSPP